MNKHTFWQQFPPGSHLCREPMPPMVELKRDMALLKSKGFNLVKLQENWMVDEPMDYIRSAGKPGAPMWAAEYQGGPVSTDFHIGRVPDAADMRRWMLATMTAGATGISFWVSRKHQGRLLVAERGTCHNGACIIFNPERETVTEQIFIPPNSVATGLLGGALTQTNDKITITLASLDATAVVFAK